MATVDLLSDGRFLFGVGAGWNRQEMANHGTDPSTRFALLEERVHVVRTIWREDESPVGSPRQKGDEADSASNGPS